MTIETEEDKKKALNRYEVRKLLWNLRRIK